MNTLAAVVLALFVDEATSTVLPIGEFPDHASCSAALMHLAFDGVCVDSVQLEDVGMESSPRPRANPRLMEG